MNKTISIAEKTHRHLTKIGDKNQSYNDIITDLLTEQKQLPKLKTVLANATKKIEETKRGARSSLAVEAADELIAALNEFVEHVEERSR